MAAADEPEPETSALAAQRQADEGLVMFLERDQLAADTSIPVPRARLNRHTKTWLWVLRVFVILLSVMVIYTFASKL